MKRLAVITARGGSKRIPKKNIKEFCGMPIIAYGIKAAIESNLFDEVMVSTDCIEIAEIAKKYGAKVPFMRSETTSNDFATITDVLLEVLCTYEKQGVEFDEICDIFPTAPFISSKILKQAAEILAKEETECVYPVVPFSYPPQRCVEIDNSYVKFSNPEYAFTRSQDLKPLYHDCGQFHFMKVTAFKQQKNLLLNKTIPIILEETQVQDIDNLTDWTIAELKYKLLQSNG